MLVSQVMDSGHDCFTGLEDFEPNTLRPDSFNAETGTFARYRANPNTGEYIIEEGGFGYQRCTSTNPVSFETEPDTFAVDYIEATPGVGLGTAALRQLVLEALASGLHVARLRITNPRAITMVERLQSDSLVLAAYYKIDPESRLHPEHGTDTFHEQPGLCTPDEARQFLIENGKIHDSDEQGSVESAIWF